MNMTVSAAPMVAHIEEAAAQPDIAVVVPVKNELENIIPLITEIDTELKSEKHEIIYVDDGSDDETPAKLLEAMQAFPQLRVYRHAQSCGQSAAVRTGVLHAHAPVIATLDGDGQNDPADIPALLKRYRERSESHNEKLIAGQRLKRQDDGLRKLSSKVANSFRSSLLGDNTPDTGCGLKLFSRDAFLRLPYFDHIHRFMPALFMREGFAIGLVEVNHRARTRGTSKYGVMNRLWVGLVDICGVLWLKSRMRRSTVSEVTVETEQTTNAQGKEISDVA